MDNGEGGPLRSVPAERQRLDKCNLVLSVNLLSQREWEELKRLQTVYARQLQEEGVLL